MSHSRSDSEVLRDVLRPESIPASRHRTLLHAPDPVREAGLKHCCFRAYLLLVLLVFGSAKWNQFSQGLVAQVKSKPGQRANYHRKPDELGLPAQVGCGRSAQKSGEKKRS